MNRKSVEELQFQLDTALDGLHTKTEEHTEATKQVEQVRKSYEMTQQESKEEMEKLYEKVALLTKKHLEAQQIIEVERKASMDVNQQLSVIIEHNTNLKERHDEEISKANEEKQAIDSKIRDKKEAWKHRKSVLEIELEGQKN